MSWCNLRGFLNGIWRISAHGRSNVAAEIEPLTISGISGVLKFCF